MSSHDHLVSNRRLMGANLWHHTCTQLKAMGSRLIFFLHDLVSPPSLLHSICQQNRSSNQSSILFEPSWGTNWLEGSLMAHIFIVQEEVARFALQTRDVSYWNSHSALWKRKKAKKKRTQNQMKHVVSSVDYKKLIYVQYNMNHTLAPWFSMFATTNDLHCNTKIQTTIDVPAFS